MRVILADVVDTASWTSELDPAEVTELIAGAALSPITNDPALSPDRDTPAETVRVNIMGAARTFDWARGLPRLRRLIYMSSGVYGYGTKGSPDDPPEPPIGKTKRSSRTPPSTTSAKRPASSSPGVSRMSSGSPASRCDPPRSTARWTGIPMRARCTRCPGTWRTGR